MKRLWIQLGLIATLAILWTGCGKGASTGEASGAKAAPTTTQHAAKGVQAGSHEDWCEEHQVPESLCTRCNPSLIAAFKATNDWCEEHGVPESQCRTCNPNLKIERPSKKGGAQ